MWCFDHISWLIWKSGHWITTQPGAFEVFEPFSWGHFTLTNFRYLIEVYRSIAALDFLYNWQNKPSSVESGSSFSRRWFDPSMGQIFLRSFPLKIKSNSLNEYLNLRKIFKFLGITWKLWSVFYEFAYDPYPCIGHEGLF